MRTAVKLAYWSAGNLIAGLGTAREDVVVVVVERQPTRPPRPMMRARGGLDDPLDSQWCGPVCHARRAAQRASLLRMAHRRGMHIRGGIATPPNGAVGDLVSISVACEHDCATSLEGRGGRERGWGRGVSFWHDKLGPCTQIGAM